MAAIIGLFPIQEQTVWIGSHFRNPRPVNIRMLMLLTRHEHGTQLTITLNMPPRPSEDICRKLYKKYKDRCETLPPCLAGVACHKYDGIIEQYKDCKRWRVDYINNRCDEVIPTTVDHPGAVEIVGRAIKNCAQKKIDACNKEKQCVPWYYGQDVE